MIRKREVLMIQTHEDIEVKQEMRMRGEQRSCKKNPVRVVAKKEKEEIVKSEGL